MKENEDALRASEAVERRRSNPLANIIPSSRAVSVESDRLWTAAYRARGQSVVATEALRGFVEFSWEAEETALARPDVEQFALTMKGHIVGNTLVIIDDYAQGYDQYRGRRCG